MKYTPLIAPNDLTMLPRFMDSEFAKIGRCFSSARELLELEELHAPPAKYREGTIVFADGSDWDPASGRGVYCYYGGSWQKLG